MLKLVISGSSLEDLRAGARAFLDGDSGTAPSAAPLPRPAPSATRAWSPARAQLLDRYPALQPLLDDFLSFLRSEEPTVGFQQLPTRVTVLLPGGRGAGMGLRAGYLILVAMRSGETHKFSIRSDSDFAPALAWLRSLPPSSR